MPCEILIVNIAKATWSRGEIVECKDTPATWGNAEALPNWVKVRITNATRAQTLNYLVVWYDNIFKFTIVSQTIQEYQVRIEKDIDEVGGGTTKQIALEVLDHLNDRWGITLISHDGNSALVRVPKPNDLAEIRNDLKDLLMKRFKTRRYYFSNADMDAVVAAGGFMELTRQQVVAKIIDRFVE